MSEVRLVQCVKLNKELPGLDNLPIEGEIGQKVYDSISKEAFKMFLEHFKMIINEYRLDLTNPATDKVFEEQMEEYFFGGGAQLPDEYVPPEK